VGIAVGSGGTEAIEFIGDLAGDRVSMAVGLKTTAGIIGPQNVVVGSFVGALVNVL